MNSGSITAVARRLALAIASILCYSVQGCCGLFEETAKGTRQWVNAEIPPGSTREAAEQALRRHGFPPTPFGPPTEVSGSKRVGGCIPELVDHSISVSATVGPDGRVTKTDVQAENDGP